MPVRVDANVFNMCAQRLECDLLSELEDMSDDLSCDMLSPCEDIWKKFDDFVEAPKCDLKCDLVSDLLDGESEAHSYAHNADVLHDCMWSGQCVEDASAHTHRTHAHTCATRKCAKSYSRPDTPFAALSSSPLTAHTFNDLLSTCDSSNDDVDSQSSMDGEHFTTASFAKVKDSLINDHSYDGSYISHNYRNHETQSLIYPTAHKAQSRMGSKMKCHKINGSKMKIIKATQISNSKPKQSFPVPTVRIIRNNQHFVVKAKNFIAKNDNANNIDSNNNNNVNVKVKEENQTKCKFSTRRKGSTVASERSVMLAQSHHQFQFRHCESSRTNFDSDNCEEQSMDSMISSDKSSKQIPPMRRREHNDSERKRRDHLRNAFLNLKDQIPKLKSAEKRPPRIMILHEATAYVNHLIDKQRYLERTLDAEVEKRERLLKKLSNEYKKYQNDD